MRILQVSPFYPPHVGGIEFHVEALSRKLVEAGHQVVVYTSSLPKGDKVELAHGVEVHRYTPLCSPINNPLLPGLLRAMVDHAEGFDVVHCHGHYHLSSTLAMLVRRFGRRPVVLTSHGTVLDFSGWRRIAETVFNKTLGRWMLRSSERVIALTHSQAVRLAELGASPRRLSTVPMWVDLPELGTKGDAAEFRSKYGVGSRKVILFVGRLLPVKGLDVLIDAAGRTTTRPVILVIGDEAPGYKGTRQALESEVARLGLERDIRFLGWFAKESLAAAYNAADLFVLPSRGEGLPVALLEAMSFGKCVLTTDVPGNRDVVKNGWNGVLVESQHPARLAEEIDRLLGDDAEREKLGKQAREDIKHDYHSDVILQKILDIYREVQGGPTVETRA